MNKEDKQLLLVDLCARLPYEVILLSQNGKVIYQTDGNTAAELLVEEGWKLYLRPMSSMTDGELIEFLEIRGMNLNSEELRTFREGKTAIVSTLSSYSRHIDWLNKHHFDYRGLIKKGLALEAPEGMYN